MKDPPKTPRCKFYSDFNSLIRITRRRGQLIPPRRRGGTDKPIPLIVPVFLNAGGVEILKQPEN